MSFSPPQMRFADIDWDGMTDIILTKESSQAGSDFGGAVILMNNACESNCSSLSVSSKREFVESTNTQFNIITEVEALYIAFFDINEDGKIDFLLISFENGKRYIRCFFNYISTDAFFLKALGMKFKCFPFWNMLLFVDIIFIILFMHNSLLVLIGLNG